MKCQVPLLLAVLALCGCQNPSTPGSDPFLFGRTTVNPPATGAICRTADPSYNNVPGGMPARAPGPSATGGYFPPAPAGTQPGVPGYFPPSTPSGPAAPGSPSGQSWTTPPAASGVVPRPVPTTSPGGVMTSPPYGGTTRPSGPSAPTGSVSPSGYPWGTTGAGVPVSPSPSAYPGGTSGYRGTAVSPPFGSNFSQPASRPSSASLGNVAPSTVRIVEPSGSSSSVAVAGGSGNAVAPSSPSATAAGAPAELAATAEEPAALMAERPRIVTTLPARPAAASAAGSTRPVREVNIMDLPPAESDPGGMQ